VLAVFTPFYLEAGHLDAMELMPDSLAPKISYNKNPLVAALLNIPRIQYGVTLHFLTIAVINKLLFFDFSHLFIKIFNKYLYANILR